MPKKEVLIYGDIHAYSSVDFINSINEVESTDDLIVRINTSGGSPEYGFGMAAKFQEFEGNKLVKVDGKAHSTGLFFLGYADEVEALDVSEFLLHRAAYPEWYEQSTLFTAEAKGNLERINKALRAAIEAKIDVKKFEELKGVKIKEIFSMDGRKEVFLTAKEAKEIGLINKINRITPSKKAQIQERMMAIAAKYVPDNDTNREEEKEEQIQSNNQKTEIKMTKEEFKAKYSGIYQEIFNEGSEAGMKAERDRVGSWMVFVDADAKAVTEGINGGEPLTATAMAELSRKAISAAAINNSQEENADDVSTDAAKDKEEPTALSEFEKSLDEKLKIK